MTEFVTPASYSHLLRPCHSALVTSCDDNGHRNIFAVAWIVSLSHKPPMLGISVHPGRFSYRLIKATGEFVVNIAPFELAGQALFCGRKSGADVDKFAATGLTAAPARLVRPPIIAECFSFLECRVAQEVVAGDHRFLMADVLAAYTRSGTLGVDGLYDVENIHPLLHLGNDSFTTLGGQISTPVLAKDPPAGAAR